MPSMRKRGGSANEGSPKRRRKTTEKARAAGDREEKLADEEACGGL
jgi:hypothetical protein